MRRVARTSRGDNGLGLTQTRMHSPAGQGPAVGRSDLQLTGGQSAAPVYLGPPAGRPMGPAQPAYPQPVTQPPPCPFPYRGQGTPLGTPGEF